MSNRFHIENSHFVVCFNCGWKGKFEISSIKINFALFWLINSDSFTLILKSKNQITIHNEIRHIRKKKNIFELCLINITCIAWYSAHWFLLQHVRLEYKARALQLISPRLCKRMIFLHNMMVSHRNYINNV